MKANNKIDIFSVEKIIEHHVRNKKRKSFSAICEFELDGVCVSKEDVHEQFTIKNRLISMKLSNISRKCDDGSILTFGRRIVSLEY